MIPLRPEEWRRVREVFDSAVGLGAGERAESVAAACRGDEDVRRRVSEMLDAHDHTQGFLETACVATVLPGRDEDLAGARFGPYQVESRVGGGGMGEVYRACDTRLGRTVAIKVLLSHTAADGPARERFEREARVVAGLSHPHICTLHDVGTYSGSTGQPPVPYLVMEFLDGETLADRLARGPLPLEVALDYAIQIASALDAAHRLDVIHRDLKPRNIMVTSSGAKLPDFGVAKAAESGSPASDGDLTTPGTIVGTVQYMAPALLNGTHIPVPISPSTQAWWTATLRAGRRDEGCRKHGVGSSGLDVSAFGLAAWASARRRADRRARRALSGSSATVGGLMPFDQELQWVRDISGSTRPGHEPKTN